MFAAPIHASSVENLNGKPKSNGSVLVAGIPVRHNKHFKHVIQNGGLPDLPDTALLGSAPVLGYSKPAPRKRNTALPVYLDPVLNPQIYKTSSIVSFDDMPMLTEASSASQSDVSKPRQRRVPKTSVCSQKADLVLAEEGADESDTSSSDDAPSSGTGSSTAEVAYLPDGGYGWVVVMASFCMQALVGGIAYVQGLMYPCFMDAMGTSKVVTAWACSMQMSIWFTGGLIAGPLVQVYGARRISLLGTLVVSLGLFVSAFSQALWMLYVFYGFVCGLGMSMIFFPSVIIVQHYFTTKRSIAVAFANAGTPFGAFLYPILVSFLIKTFGWRGELVVLSAITLHGLVFASFFRPLLQPKPKVEKEAEAEPEDRSVTEVIISSVVSLGHASMTSKERSKLQDFFANLLDLSLWKNPNMVFDVFAYGLFAFGFIMPSMFLPVKASENHLLPPKPEILLSVLGFSDVIGRLSSGLIGRLLGRKRLVVYGGGMVICGTATILSSFIGEFPALIVYCMVFGLCIGMSRAYSSVVVTDMLGIANLPKAYGFKMFINGICVLCSGPLAAFIFDLTSNIDIAFCMIGSIQLVGGSLVFILLVLRKCGCAEVI